MNQDVELRQFSKIIERALNQAQLEEEFGLGGIKAIHSNYPAGVYQVELKSGNEYKISVKKEG